MSSYLHAQESYAALGVDTEAALATLATIPISLHCWQGDDVAGFEGGGKLTGGIQVTGNYPGKARNLEELRTDLDKALSLIPGTHRLNLHASYGDFDGKKVDRNEVDPTHFASWIRWCQERGLGMDFNSTYFSHDLSSDGFTLSHADPAIREFWIEHGIRCRQIGSEVGRQLGTPCVTNVWVPDGSKDLPVDRKGPRQRLEASLDAIFKQPLDSAHHLDAVECKLFGIGSEAYVVGSHEFYLGYATKNQILLCLDAGHFHPTENLSDKISSVLQFVPEIILHVSRGVRWDSDHVVLLDDPTKAMMEEIIRGEFIPRTHIGLDFFDATINRIAAWTIGTRNTLKALLLALLEPMEKLRAAENAGDLTTRLALFEEEKTLPFAAVWDEHCRRQNVPEGILWLEEVKAYERDILSRR